MSHIVKGKVTVAYSDAVVFITALTELGIVLTNERLYRVMVGYTTERYDLVLQHPERPQFRLGFNLEDGRYMPYQEDYGDVGEWTRRVSAELADMYLAQHYAAALRAENYQVEIRRENGHLEVIAEEAVW